MLSPLPSLLTTGGIMNTLKINTTTNVLLLAVIAIGLANRTDNLNFFDGDTTRLTDQNEQQDQEKEDQEAMNEEQIQLGNFSVSLAVKDLEVSQAFYEKLGFKHVFGAPEQKYVIMQNETSTIGLFEGMFEDNILTFNPGWDRNAQALEEFQDVRELQATFMERGITPVTKAKEGNEPASFVIVDPDGNTILIDQHVPKPE